MIFAETIDPSLPAIIGSFAVMLGGFFAITKIMLNSATKDREADRKERKEFINVLGKVAKSSNKVAKATEQSAREAKQRNGHLGQQNVEIVKLITANSGELESIKNSSMANAESNAKILTQLESSATQLTSDNISTALKVQVVADKLEKK